MVKLQATVRPFKDMRGRIKHFTAKLGSWEADGRTKAEAETKLAARIDAMANEDCSPVVRLDPADGHAWLAYRDNGGEWTYTHCRKIDAGTLGQTIMQGWTYGASMPGRAGAIRSMLAHMAQLHGGDPDPVKSPIL